jgi:hypothetical protein
VDDLYERLVAKVAAAKASPPPCTCGECGDVRVAVEAAAILMVRLEAHKPRETSCPTAAFAGSGEFECAACRVEWSRCETVRAIARALDVPIGEPQT